MTTEFTPILSLSGGALIGASAVLLLATQGRIAGISTIAGGLLAPMSDPVWRQRAGFVLGLLLAAPLVAIVTGAPMVQTVGSNLPLMAIAGVLVGFGSAYGGGCTSGHGVCGLARLSPRSVIATGTFMAVAITTVYVARHMLELDPMRFLSSLVSGLLFGIGLVLSGMSDPAKVLNFLDLAGSWDPSLIFVMGGAVIVTFIGFRLVRKRSEPLLDTQFHLPTARSIDAPLVTGAAIFGLGWGLAGFCPGPALTALPLLAPGTLVFVPAMFAGFWLGRRMPRSTAVPATTVEA